MNAYQERSLLGAFKSGPHNMQQSPRVPTTASTTLTAGPAELNTRSIFSAILDLIHIFIYIRAWTIPPEIKNRFPRPRSPHSHTQSQTNHSLASCFQAAALKTSLINVNPPDLIESVLFFPWKCSKYSGINICILTRTFSNNLAIYRTNEFDKS